METTKWNLDELRQNAPAYWDQYNRYRQNSLDLFYKFQSPQYYLFPDWLDAKLTQDLAKRMECFAPFSLVTSTDLSQAEQAEYTRAILNVISYLDAELRSRG